MRGSERTSRTTYGTLAKIKVKGGIYGRAGCALRQRSSSAYVNMAAAENVDTQGEIEDGSASAEDDGHPWSYLATMFSYLGMGENTKTYRMKCMLCLPKCHEIKAFNNSPSNLKKHIERAHPHHLKKYEQLTSQKRKRASEAGTSTTKQTTLLDSRSISQSAVDRAIVQYVVNGLQPLSTVENEAFRELLTDLLPTAKIITRVTLRSRIGDLAKAMRKVLTEEMSKVDHIATTTDCWSVRRRSFLGVTAHWVNPTDLTRRSAAWLDYIREQLEDPSADAGSGSSDEGDFFHILKSSHKTPRATKQLDSYLAYTTDDIKILKTFPVVLKLSVKLNIPLPASAACERLFSIAGLIFSPKRARLAANTFENQLLLRMNRKFNFST
ncbi:uncharacterized protein LOC121641846 [Melanotaenia boesemani]|uniref:uncharacterized protein LOC121641846 n=1 Tax=Melanotaenia boesemani TaxID=1250792 RepID=UPI001C040EAA|nr:uncharacterized protein LOC121641846 [Melanotaenia boesemani]